MEGTGTTYREPLPTSALPAYCTASSPPLHPLTACAQPAGPSPAGPVLSSCCAAAWPQAAPWRRSACRCPRVSPQGGWRGDECGHRPLHSQRGGRRARGGVGVSPSGGVSPRRPLVCAVVSGDAAPRGCPAYPRRLSRRHAQGGSGCGRGPRRWRWRWRVVVIEATAEIRCILLAPPTSINGHSARGSE